MKYTLLIMLLTFLNHMALAQERLSGVFTYQGRAFQSDGVTPLTGTAVFSVQIRSANGNCLLYQESHSGIDLTASGGFFALNIGDGTATSGLELYDAFTNLGIAKTTLSGTCGGAYTPLNLDSRVLRITVNVGGGGAVALDDQYIYTVPQALVAETLNGFKYNEFVQSLTTTQRNALTSMVSGTTIYNITTGKFNRYNGASWGEAFGSSIADADNDTKIQVEESADEDKIRFDTAGSERMIIDETGNVGIGVPSPIEKLEVDGNVKAISFISTSDRRLKTNIRVAPGIESILKLQGVQYNFISTGDADAGVIAQEVEKVFPDAVRTDASGYKAVKYNYLLAPLIEATKQTYGLCKQNEVQIENIARQVSSAELSSLIQDENIEVLKSDIVKLKLENSELKKRLDLIEKKLNHK